MQQMEEQLAHTTDALEQCESKLAPSERRLKRARQFQVIALAPDNDDPESMVPPIKEAVERRLRERGEKNVYVEVILEPEEQKGVILHCMMIDIRGQSKQA